MMMSALVNIQAFVLITLLILPFISFAQILDAKEKVTIALDTKERIVLYKKADAFDEQTMNYYYLPCLLKLSTSVAGTSEYSFVQYKERNKIQGGLLHFLVKWGLSSKQLSLADSLLKVEKGEEAKLMGAVTLEPIEGEEHMSIQGEKGLAALLLRSKPQLGKVPLYPHAKSAVAFHLSAEDAIELGNVLQANSSTLEDLYISLSFGVQFRVNYQIGTIPFQLKENLRKLLNQ